MREMSPMPGLSVDALDEVDEMVVVDVFVCLPKERGERSEHADGKRNKASTGSRRFFSIR